MRKILVSIITVAGIFAFAAAAQAGCDGMRMADSDTTTVVTDTTTPILTDQSGG